MLFCCEFSIVPTVSCFVSWIESHVSQRLQVWYPPACIGEFEIVLIRRNRMMSDAAHTYVEKNEQDCFLVFLFYLNLPAIF